MAMRKHELEDLSTIGMEWDEETAASSQVTIVTAPLGDIDEDDIEGDIKRYNEEHALIIDGFKCPDEYLAIITPMEFEEMVNLFTKFDVDKSGTIDKHEARKILIYIGLESSFEKAEELLSLVDIDQSGEIDFEEFCTFIVLMKRGDPRLSGFSSMLGMLSSTPLGELERQAISRKLKIYFKLVEKREATLTQPTLWIFEVQLRGTFHRLVDGEIIGENLIKKFQGMGHTTKEAKYNAASNALINLGEAMPGVLCKAGEFPDDWLEWLNENLWRGVDPGKLCAILAAKGFQPQLNLSLMYKLLTWSSLDQFVMKHPDLDLTDCSIRLHEDFIEWVKDTAKKGIDGKVILKVLEERAIDLKNDNLYIAQKLQNNDLGTLKDTNGNPPELLDFFHACKNGYYDDVLIYCKCNALINEEKVDRHNCSRMTGIAYAAMYGHADCVRILLQYGSDPNITDMRGRSPLHHAAIRGYKEACDALIEGGAMMFAGDMQGNTPLHLAAMNNQYDAVNYLAFKGLELTRLITSDKVRVKKDTPFDQLIDHVFKVYPKIKLSIADTERFEKQWLSEAANYMHSLMDHDVKHMIAPCCKEIMNDVLLRFDPRPESGIFISTIQGEQILIKSINTSADLSILLKNVYRQTSLDSINHWKRTALHMACDANQINSHEKVICRLIDFHGCNVNMRDMHNRRPIDLLIKDKYMQNMPSATQIREELLITRREQTMTEMFTEFDKKDFESVLIRRQAIIDECIQREDKISERIWHCLREGSRLIKTFGDKWEMFEDPDCMNYFYTKIPQNVMQGDVYDHYSWHEPIQAKSLIDYTMALNYLIKIRSILIRQHDEWITYKCNKTNIQYYYNLITNQISFTLPKHLNWRYIFRESEKTKIKLGYASEWEVYNDKYGNPFYKNNITRKYEYDRPLDAVEVSAAEKICTAFQNKGKASMQNWYSCEQCNRAWKQSPLGSSGSVRICEGCIARCHFGHKGIRLVKYSQALCICDSVCQITSSKCNACVISLLQAQVQQKAEDLRFEQERIRLRNIEMPPIFALVPRYTPAGRLKAESGWLICRLCKTPAVINEDGDVGDLMIDQDKAATKLDRDQLSDSDESMGSQSIDSKGSKSIISNDSESLASVNSIANAKLLVKSTVNFMTLPDNLIIQDGLPSDWIELYDVEEPPLLKYEDQVLCSRYNCILKQYGTIKNKARPGFYRVTYQDRSLPDEILERSYIELISRRRFFCNIQTGQIAWTVEEANDSPILSESLVLTGSEWVRLYNKSILRRSFDTWDEMIYPLLDQVFYVHIDNFLMEKTILKLQNIFRAKFRYIRPHQDWTSISFTFDVPESVSNLKRIRAGWAYLRRRSVSIGEFLDKDGSEWEEYMDKRTSEYFYWQEGENIYQWDKPELFKRKTDFKEAYKVGEDIMFIFPGRRVAEVAVIIKVRYDDETGEDMYDLIHKYNNELSFKWVPRISLKLVPKEGDALMLAKLEKKWINQLRRQREADDRKAKREKELLIAAEFARLENMKSVPTFKTGQKIQESAVSANARIIRGRIKRIDLESQEIREETDQVEGEQRRQRIADEMAIITKGKYYSRSDILTMQRALDLKIKMEDKVTQRNILRKELLAKKQESTDRTLYVEDTIRKTEIRTTTPRSLLRRRIVRRLHTAMKRQDFQFMVCEWGCGDWFKVGKEQADHQLRRCVRRIIGCTLGCPLKNTEEYWLLEYKPPLTNQDKEQSDELSQADTGSEIHYGGSLTDRAKTPKIEDISVGVVTNQQYHETEECPKRLIMCPKNCLEWVVADTLKKHLTEFCTKRPAKPIACRLGCGIKFGGAVETLIEAEDDRLQHENEECDFRIVRCNFQFDDGKLCAAQMPACDREEHRDFHITMQGMMTYAVPGTYVYRVPKNISRLKIQVWGGGGGSGCFKGRQAGNGGGGAFVEAIITVEHYSVLELVVGAGGGAGVYGTEIEPIPIEEQRRLMAIRRNEEIHLLKGKKIIHEDPPSTELISFQDQSCGVTLGGQPGGGEGYGGNGCWASGGGGGYSIVSKRTNIGNQALIVAAGGGGGSSLHGLSGGAMDGILYGTLIDPINGETATVDHPGAAGDSGSTFNAAWPATMGSQWQGGNGCEFGAGGGGGYYGGGGGGTSPGISGGGGGGSSYIYTNICKDYTMVMGHGIQPGGLNHNPPLACGLGDWDKVGGFAGQGAIGDSLTTLPGNNGAIRLVKPGFY